MFSTKLIH